MSTVFRLSVPNLAGVLAMALAPLFLAFVQPHPMSLPSNVASAQVSPATTLADASLNSAVIVETGVSEQQTSGD